MILITGCAGFIGYHLAKILIENGKSVIGIDNLERNYDIKLKEKRLELLKNYQHFIFNKYDILKMDELEYLFKDNQFDVIIHLAAKAGIRNSIDNPIGYLETNTKGTLNLLEMMKKYNQKKMIMGSTSSLYAGQEIPFKENNEMMPISPYAATKGAAELITYTYSYLYDMDVTILRFFTVYGELGRPDMSYYKFIKALKEDKIINVYGDGKQHRDFTYVSDIIDAIIQSFTLDGFNLINVGTGNIITVNELISKLETLMNRKAKVDYIDSFKADMDITQADNNKALKKLNWFPKVSIDEGLKKTIGGIE